MKLLKLFLAAALPILLSVAAFAEEAAPVGVNEVSLSDGGSGAAALDGERSTAVRSGEGLTIELSLDTDASQMYLIWDGPAPLWTLSTPEGASRQNEHGFLHEYIQLSASTSTLSMELPAGAVLCDVYFFSGGAMPEWVQNWEPPLEDADMLVLPTHADDEHLWFGGTLPLYAGQLGYGVQVAYMTNHWGESYRPHELLNGLWKVGVRAYPVMGPFPDMYSESADAAAGQYGRGTVTEWQTEMLRRFKPEVVVAHDIGGEYGHGAHMLNAETLLAALEVSGDPAAFPESAKLYGPWEVSKAYLHLWAEHPVVMNWDEPLSAFGGKTAFEMAAEGYGEHISQHQWDFAVRQSGPYDCRKFGLAWSTVGEDTEKNDLFENIEYPPKEPEPPEPEPEPPEPEPEPPEPEPEPPESDAAPQEPETAQEPEPPAPEALPEAAPADDITRRTAVAAALALPLICAAAVIIRIKLVRKNGHGSRNSGL